jgi:hypothetical protein
MGVSRFYGTSEELFRYLRFYLVRGEKFAGVILDILWDVGRGVRILRSVLMGFHQSFMGINYADVSPY